MHCTWIHDILSILEPDIFRVCVYIPASLTGSNVCA